MYYSDHEPWRMSRLEYASISIDAAVMLGRDGTNEIQRFRFSGLLREWRATPYSPARLLILNSVPDLDKL